MAADQRLSQLPVGRAVLIGAAQVAALATPVILAAGVLKLGDLAGPLGAGIRPQIVVGSLLSGVGAYLSVRYLTRYFETRSLRPFGIYCVVAGVGCLLWFWLR